VADRAWATYSGRYGRDQSVERLAERGGFSWGEMDDLFPGWRDETCRWRELERENASLLNRVADLTAVGNTYKADAERLARERDDFVDRVTVAEVACEQAESRAREYASLATRNGYERDAAQRKNSEWKTGSEALQAELNRLTAKLDESRSTLATLRRREEVLEDKLGWALERLDESDPEVRAAWDLVNPGNPAEMPDVVMCATPAEKAAKPPCACFAEAECSTCEEARTSSARRANLPCQACDYCGVLTCPGDCLARICRHEGIGKPGCPTCDPRTKSEGGPRPDPTPKG
jgi:hypothetical protein